MIFWNIEKMRHGSVQARSSDRQVIKSCALFERSQSQSLLAVLKELHSILLLSITMMSLCTPLGDFTYSDSNYGFYSWGCHLHTDQCRRTPLHVPQSKDTITLIAALLVTSAVTPEHNFSCWRGSVLRSLEVLWCLPSAEIHGISRRESKGPGFARRKPLL